MIDLGDGLVMRRGRAADAEPLAEFNADVHREQADGPPDFGIAGWTRDLLERPHPTAGPDDFLIVEETATGRIVSSLCVIPQTWSYEGVPVPAGRVELVGTSPDYRRRGLVRRQMTAIHQRSDGLGHLVQGITGIPWYYRQFGYEMTVSLDGRRGGYLSAVPALAADAVEPFTIRPAEEADLRFVERVDRAARGRWLLSCERDGPQWLQELRGHRPDSVCHIALRIIEDTAGERVGFLGVWPFLWGTSIGVRTIELDPDSTDATWFTVMPSVLRAVKAEGEALAAAKEGAGCDGLWFVLGDQHPVYDAIRNQLPLHHRSYAWYLRVPDIGAFLRNIAPVLERRLAESPARGHSGELKLDLPGRGGCVIGFESGRVVRAESTDRPVRFTAGAILPELTFLHLLFGHRSLEELRHMWPDCLVEGDEARVLLEALFPKRPSFVWGVD